jgi:hypothetical protein
MKMNSTITISIDFDGTLSLPEVQAYAKTLMDRGYKLMVLTTRYEKYLNQDLIKITKKLGINKVIYTNGEDKHYYIDGIDLHLDNDERELRLISRYTGIEVINVTDKEWKETIENLLF